MVEMEHRNIPGVFLTTEDLPPTQHGSHAGNPLPGYLDNDNLEGAVRSDPDSANVGIHLHALPNLPPDEAERRRQVAIKLLSDANIDPATSL